MYSARSEALFYETLRRNRVRKASVADSTGADLKSTMAITASADMRQSSLEFRLQNLIQTLLSDQFGSVSDCLGS